MTVDHEVVWTVGVKGIEVVASKVASLVEKTADC